jgi:hypothetical protein
MKVVKEAWKKVCCLFHGIYMGGPLFQKEPGYITLCLLLSHPISRTYLTFDLHLDADLQSSNWCKCTSLIRYVQLIEIEFKLVHFATTF